MRALRRASSACAGWLADRGVPRVLRRAVYGGYCRITGADPGEAELALELYPSLGAFFVRRLRAGSRPIDADPRALVSPCDGTLQALGPVRQGALFQAKGQLYTLRELLLQPVDEDALEGAWSATIYLSPRDYHRVHAPFDLQLSALRWLPGERRSVAPAVLDRVPRLLCSNERVVLELDGPAGRAYLVMVGALNVGRIRVVGVPDRSSPARPVSCARGSELARFELGSTVVLVVPGARALEGLASGSNGSRSEVRLGQRLALLP